MYRIGFSEDIHPIVNNRKLVLGGIEIRSEFGLDGHSDADVITHSLTEAIFGALAIGDLGSHFPDSDSKFKDISSLILLEEAVKIMNDRGYEINNVDIQVACAKPKLSPYIYEMRKTLSGVLKTDITNVSIKAMSFNKVGPIGNSEAIRSQAIVMLLKK